MRTSSSACCRRRGLRLEQRGAGEAGRIDYWNEFYEREYVTPLGGDSFSIVADAAELHARSRRSRARVLKLSRCDDAKTRAKHSEQSKVLTQFVMH